MLGTAGGALAVISGGLAYDVEGVVPEARRELVVEASGDEAEPCEVGRGDVRGDEGEPVPRRRGLAV